MSEAAVPCVNSVSHLTDWFQSLATCLSWNVRQKQASFDQDDNDEDDWPLIQQNPSLSWTAQMPQSTIPKINDYVNNNARGNGHKIVLSPFDLSATFTRHCHFQVMHIIGCTFSGMMPALRSAVWQKHTKRFCNSPAHKPNACQSSLKCSLHGPTLFVQDTINKCICFTVPNSILGPAARCFLVFPELLAIEVILWRSN